MNAGNIRIVFWVGFWTFLIDQITKYLVVHWMNLRELGSIDVLPPFVNFRMAWNYGINFGLFAENSSETRWVLIAVAFAIIGFVVYWIWKDTPKKLGLMSAGMLIGGAIGNVIDRLLYGAVADFLNLSCCGVENPYAFNVADIAIFVGAAGLAIFGSNSEKSA